MADDLTREEIIKRMKADIYTRLLYDPECEWAQEQGRLLADLIAETYIQ